MEKKLPVCPNCTDYMSKKLEKQTFFPPVFILQDTNMYIHSSVLFHLGTFLLFLHRFIYNSSSPHELCVIH